MAFLCGPKILRYHKTLNLTVLQNFLSALLRRERSLQNLEANATSRFQLPARSLSTTSCDAILGYTLLHPVKESISFRFPSTSFSFFFDVNFSAPLHFFVGHIFSSIFKPKTTFFIIVDHFFLFEVKFYLLDQIFLISLFISPSKSILFLGLFLSATKRHRAFQFVYFDKLCP